jgi:light-regulated signal transduction histidine kinase (bacteriophytochrome)
MKIWRDPTKTWRDLHSIASHDLQEPLRMMTAYSQLLVKQYPSGLHGQGAATMASAAG